MGVKLQRGEEGAALVETALVVPVILLLLFSIFEMGLAFARYQVLSNTSREVARVVALFDKTCDVKNGGLTTKKRTDIRDTIERYDDALGMEGQIQGPGEIPAACLPGNSEVVLTFVHQLPVLGNFGLPNSITLRSRTVMRNES